MRVAFVIPHFFSGGRPGSAHGSERPAARAMRAVIFDRVLFQIHTLFAPRYHALNIIGSEPGALNLYEGDNPNRLDFEIFVFTTRGAHLLADVQANAAIYRHMETDVEPPFLGFECARWIRDHIGLYDFFCYLDDDMLIRDPLFFRKIKRFNGAFDAGARGLVLAPQRYEETLRAGDPDRYGKMTRLYIDYQSRPEASFAGERLKLKFAGQYYEFEPALNPNAGCYIVDGAQAMLMAQHSEFLDRTKTLTTPMDTSVWGFVSRALKVYKPALNSLSFLDVQHGHQGVLLSHYEVKD